MFKPMPHYAMLENFTTKVHFMPWVGCNYSLGGLFNQRILVLGESHYSKVHIDKPAEITKYYTRHIMQLWAVQKNAAFYSKVRNVILSGSELSVTEYNNSESRQKFWDSVAFYNYVQEYVGTGARKRPKPQQWEMAAEAFGEVLEKLRPDVCLVLGKELWRNLPKADEIDEITGIKFKRLIHNGYETILAHTPHPASFGLFNKNKVVPIVRRLLELDSSKRMGKSSTL